MPSSDAVAAVERDVKLSVLNWYKPTDGSWMLDEWNHVRGNDIEVSTTNDSPGLWIVTLKPSRAAFYAVTMRFDEYGDRNAVLCNVRWHLDNGPKDGIVDKLQGDVWVNQLPWTRNGPQYIRFSLRGARQSKPACLHGEVVVPPSR